ncbi:MAG: hypothetical protein JXP34_19360, partial [Planctomycetes bacterium]|nr:hypothetical protein [Planctomycetota bacterium]
FRVIDLSPGDAIDVEVRLTGGGTLDAYWMYGPTPDDPSPHWYEFAFDGTTGAEIAGTTITLHFVDGLRGDGDITADGTIVDPGAPAVISTGLFRRGDTNADGQMDIGDAICALNFLFGAPEDTCKHSVPVCLDAADANDDGSHDLGDAITILNLLFLDTGPLPEPFTECGLDPSGDAFDCAHYPPCRTTR